MVEELLVDEILVEEVVGVPEPVAEVVVEEVPVSEVGREIIIGFNDAEQQELVDFNVRISLLFPRNTVNSRNTVMVRKYSKVV